MPTSTVDKLLADIRLLSEEQHAIVHAVLALVKQLPGSYAEEVKYGGILFSKDGVQFGGVFVYKQHVSVEFSRGAAIADAFGHLEGSGKGRRHLKLGTLGDIAAKQLAPYLPLALRAASAGAAPPLA
ncbi:DUF1801 domain-containing protein [Paucibacter sp. APW11]|uniref:DUF1801 domain-containing protein n=1 Tax=Roseateles aquae TaxID=3077235 RepID=A0ABU3PFM3_9BURK|nr:DUF1801 domain-containing protein [Paucibacter sp. APW11]MDT9001369.1 DUF1801 domain-containing protein [Paucibacter sp. APW11]